MSQPIRRIGFAYNPTSEAAQRLRGLAIEWCQERGIAYWDSSAAEFQTLVSLLPTTDLLVVLGGDGTFLRAARAVIEVDVPVLGVNLGKVGFLSKVEAAEMSAVLDQILEDGYTTEERMVLGGAIHPGGRPNPTQRFTALNDITVARGALARACRLDVTIGSSHLATFLADGLVVSSPTGSTGYAFAAGGPILDPISRNLVVTPIAGYLSAIRSVVVSPRQRVRCRVVDAHEVLVSIDGREDHRLVVGDVVLVEALQRPIRLVEPKGAIPFWDLLRQKVQLLPQ